MLHFLFLNGVSGGEIIIIFLVILVFFGSKKIPDFARIMGRGIRQFKDATREIQRDIEDSAKDIQKTKDEISDSIKKTGDEVKSNIKKNLDP